MKFSDIQKATVNDLESTMDVFSSVTEKMLSEKIDQWNHDYPDRATVEYDISQGEQYVIRQEGRVVATIVLNSIQDEQYKSVHWHAINKNVFVIHRLAVHADCQGMGLAKKLCTFAESMAKEIGMKSIRLDAFAGNPYSNNLYQKLGYTKANGLCYFRLKAIPFYCYDKIL